ncbi:hypothetical protein ABZ588_30935 [Streptomyces althioticus]|uniref:hypothetical protein n=1 Tax=Streptomyces althioticus TaxID=83380 RepID=UPI0033D8D17F
MDAAMAGLLTAAVGVAGTLGSAWLTQNRGDALRREEWERQDRARRAESDAQRADTGRAALRESYTELNAAARHYLTTLSDYYHALRAVSDGVPQESVTADETLAAVEAARVEYRRLYAEAQMIVPDAVLVEVRRASHRLGAVYGALIRLTRGTAREGDDLAAVRDAVQETWDVLARMRVAMRRDLGTTGPSPR